MKQILLALIFLSSNFLTSFEKFKLNDDSFLGHWGTNDSSYYLTIVDKKFITYKFIAVEDENGLVSWQKVNSPGTEELIKKEGNIAITNYTIEDQNYFVKITYTLIGYENLRAEFDGTLNNESYYNVIDYKRLTVD